MGKGKGGGKIEVNEYLMSMHVGVCSEADALTSIHVGEKLAWSGEQTSAAAIAINKSSLFGGEKKEGGVKGTVTYLPGSPNQVLPDALAQKLGRASGADCPGFRGVASLFFTGGSYSGLLSGIVKSGGALSSYTNAGFHWVTNNPYLKDLWVGVKRAPKGLNPAQAMIPRIGSSGFVEFASAKTATVTWWQSCFAQTPADKARMGIGFINDQGELIGDDIHWATMSATTAMVWTERSVSATSPSGTVGLRVYMEMEREAGSNNDGYIDDINFTFDSVTVPLTNYNAESSNDFGWVVDAGNLGIRSANPAPHGGTSYFTGGSSLKTRAYQTITQAAVGPDANPAHIIYECLTNRDWGMGAPSTIINVASFEEAGVTLLLERLGLSMIWTQQTTIEAFVTEVLDHIQAMLYVNPNDGLLTLKLVRGDYDTSELRDINPDNAKLTKFERVGWGEITNEIVVTWTNPENEQDETVTIQDNAAIAAQGGIVSDSRNYYGVRSAELAMQLAARDLRTASTPLASCEVELNRQGWNILPGEVVTLTWSERGLNAVPMRVGPVDYGKPGDPKISVSLIEDIFAYATTEYDAPPTTGWEDDDVVPVPMAHSKVITVPSFFAANYLPQTVAGLADIEYPEVVAGVLASSPNAVAYDIYGERVGVDGTPYDSSLTTNTVAGWATLSVPLNRAATSEFVAFSGGMGGIEPGQGIFVFIGGDAVGDEDCEVALITEAVGNSYTLKRGVLDTIPRIWDAGTPCYFIDIGSSISDLLIRSDAESLTYKLLSRTVGGILAVEDAPDLTATLNGRPHYPLRPANVKVNGDGVGPISILGVDPIPVTWSNRNRLMENSQVVYWDDANVSPEDGQTTTIEVVDAAGTLITSYTGLTGTSYDVPASGLAGSSLVTFRVKSVRDGFDSLQAYAITSFTQTGYGLQYGLNYGGAGDPTSGGETGGGGGTGAFPDTVSWSEFNDISSTTYAALTSTQTVSLAGGDTLQGSADLSYQTTSNTYRLMRAKWQYRIHDATDWIDFGGAVEGTLGNGHMDIDGEILITQEVEGLAAQDYDVRLVAIINSGGAVLSTVGTATASVA